MSAINVPSITQLQCSCCADGVRKAIVDLHCCRVLSGQRMQRHAWLHCQSSPPSCRVLGPTSAGHRCNNTRCWANMSAAVLTPTTAPKPFPVTNTAYQVTRTTVSARKGQPLRPHGAVAAPLTSARVYCCCKAAHTALAHSPPAHHMGDSELYTRHTLHALHAGQASQALAGVWPAVTPAWCRLHPS